MRYVCIPGGARCRPYLFVFLIAGIGAGTLGRPSAGETTPPNRTVACVRVSEAPSVDGHVTDAAWAKAPVTDLVLLEADPRIRSQPINAKLRAVFTADTIAFALSWPDATRDESHKPWVWDEASQSYVAGPDREDVAALAFPMSGAFTANMLSGEEAVWDVWQWKAARTGRAGYAMDKRHIFSREEHADTAKAFSLPTGRLIWIARPEDTGTSPQGKQPAPSAKGEAVVPQYIPQRPSGSAADIRAEGHWEDGRWTVEFARALDTGHDDDVSLLSLRTIPFGVAIFDHEEHGDHSTSGPLDLHFVWGPTAGAAASAPAGAEDDLAY